MPDTINYEALTKEILKSIQSGPPNLLPQLPAYYKAISGSPVAGGYGHGVSGPQPAGVAGLFTFPGLEPGIVNAMVMPRLGLLDLLPSRTSIFDYTDQAIMTGVTDSSGTDPATPCADAKVAGLMKLCTHRTVWGLFSRMTREIDIKRAGRLIDRSDFNDLTLVGDPLVANPLEPAAGGGNSAALALRSEAAKVFFEYAVTWGRDFGPLLYTGNPTNNNAGGGYKEPYGLDILINDGYQDAETAQACPAADSIIRDAGSREINTNGAYYVRQFTNIYRNLRYNAVHMGLDPATWVIAMPWAMFYELTEVWACAYMTYRCSEAGIFSASQPQITDSAATIALRDSMRGDIYNRTGQYLLMDGQKVPVVMDDTIAETVGAGATFTSGAYFVPLRIVGNRPATYLEYFNYAGPYGAMAAAELLAPNGFFYTTNGGRFLFTRKAPLNTCVQIQGWTEWRPLCDAPQLAARFTSISYTPVAHQRGWDPDDLSYYVDGGRTDRGSFGPSFYPPAS